jgi:hypothetical protein
MIARLLVSRRFSRGIDPGRIADAGGILVAVDDARPDGSTPVTIRVEHANAEIRRRLAELLGANLSAGESRAEGSADELEPVLIKVSPDTWTYFRWVTSAGARTMPDVIRDVLSHVVPRLADVRHSPRSRGHTGADGERWLSVSVPHDVRRATMAWSIDAGIDEATLIQTILEDHVARQPPALRHARPVLTKAE